jgi:acyl-phosphate glycerol 3-phosphate acyltransferase
MMAILVSLAAIALAYLIGSIPFGLLIARWFGKVDIRTVGSGNIGATNVGRVLGFRFFVVVFLLDFLKGFLPTYFFSGLASKASGSDLVDLKVLVAVAAILGHNFPLYLRFKGGKGVATSLGSVFALDPIASLASATGFTVFLLLIRYVSMSSILGGLVWLIAHFARVANPLSREEIALTVASIGLMGLLIVRHRKNLVRIGAGTEPKVNLRKKKKDKERPSGKIATVLVATLTALAGLGAFGLNARRKFEVVAGPYRIVEVARVATGHQRAERLVFADHGKLLAATCPRYGRVMLYRVTEANALDLVRDIELEGRPVALSATVDRLFVLVRPNNDARHVEEGWWETFDLAGNPIGSKVRVGLYPDDLAITPDGRHALVLTSGRGEGGNHRPMPMITVYDVGAASENPKVVGQLAFDKSGDDPARLALSDEGTTAAVSLQGSNAVAWVDLTDLAQPRLLARRAWPEPSRPDSLRFDHRGGLLATDEAEEALWYQAGPNAEPTVRPIEGGIGEAVEIPGMPDFLAMTLPFDSSVAFVPSESSLDEPLARLPLKGRANLASTRPLGIAFNADRHLIAVANRSGGSVHLIALQTGEASR